MHLPALDDLGGDREVAQPGLARGADIRLIDLGCPATSRTGTTLPGLDGSAISGSSVERSISSSTS